MNRSNPPPPPPPADAHLFVIADLDNNIIASASRLLLNDAPPRIVRKQVAEISRISEGLFSERYNGLTFHYSKPQAQLVKRVQSALREVVRRYSDFGRSKDV